MDVLKKTFLETHIPEQRWFRSTKIFRYLLIDVKKKLRFFCFFLLRSARVIGSTQHEQSRTSKNPYRGGAECEVGAFSNRKRKYFEGSNSGTNFDPSSLHVYDSKHSNLALRSTCAHAYKVAVLNNQFFFILLTYRLFFRCLNFGFILFFSTLRSDDGFLRGYF